MTVNVKPMADWIRAARFRPRPAPIFPDGEPSQDEIRMALELFDALDEDSQRWYGIGFRASLEARLRG